MKTVLSSSTSQWIYKHTKSPWNRRPFPRVATILSIPLCRFRNRALCSFLPTKEYTGGVHFPDVPEETDEVFLRTSPVLCARATSFTKFTHGSQVSYCEFVNITFSSAGNLFCLQKRWGITIISHPWLSREMAPQLQNHSCTTVSP